ncbi:MAG: oligopeptidase B [Verrucomicrobiales bacterium]|jgi:oligopeptidase B
MSPTRHQLRLIATAILWCATFQPTIMAESPTEPIAKRVPHELKSPHGHVRQDPYFWLRDRDNPEVTDYLKAENAYHEAKMADTKLLQKTLFKEIKGRIKQDDSTVPDRDRNFEYYTRHRDGEEYPLHCRYPVGDPDKEQILLDVPSMAEGHDFYELDDGDVSSNENLLVFSVDTVGRRFYELRVKDLTTGELLADKIPNVTGNHAWANDDKTIFYSKQDPDTLRDHQVYRHVLGTPVEDDVLIYEEKDETYYCYVYKAKSDKFIVIGSSQTLSDEIQLIDADAPNTKPKVFTPRRRDLEYDIEHFGDRFYVRTNKDAKNFRLMSCPIDKTGEEHWTEIIPNRGDTYLSSIEVFKDYLVVSERTGALIQMRIRNPEGAWHNLDFGEPAYTAWLDTNLQFDTEILRFGFSSLKTPESVFDYNMRTREKVLLKRDPVLGGYDPDNYICERLWTTARDGTRVPISIVYRKGFEKNGKAPLLLYSYGSYGHSTDPSFGSARVSLLDRGFAYAIAHVRGGQEMGRQWYEDGRLLEKKNTYFDFIDCAEHLIKEGYTCKEQLYANGGSAGGLLMGAIANLRPDLFNGIIADVPFVDVVTTMLDDTIPLTTSEYDEWGNPNEKEFYDYMLSYSPYDQVEKKAYPNILVIAGLHDSQVQYWEPAKWVAKLRHERSDKSKLLMLKTEMSAGHGGPTGRYDRYKEIAFDYAFLLKLAGKQ